MPAKPVALFCAFGLGVVLTIGGLRPVGAVKAPLPTIMLFPSSAADIPALVDLRTRLRLDGHLEVLTYDIESAAVQRIAAETSHPEWLVAPALTDETRMAMSRALGVAYYAVVSPGRDPDGTHIQLVETAPTARIFDWEGVNRQFGAHAIETQAVTVMPPIPVVVATAPTPAVVATAPTPAVVATASSDFPAVKIIVGPVTNPEVMPIAPASAAPVMSSLPAPSIAISTPSKIIPAPQPTVQVAGLPEEVTASPVVGIPLPVPQVETTAPSAPITPVAPIQPPVAAPLIQSQSPTRTEDLSAAAPLIRKGDSALSGGDIVGAISLYRQAVNNAPLSEVPRLKLALAYKQGGMIDKSLDEAKRALEIAPDSQAIQQFLSQLDQDSGTSDGAITRYRALLERNPQDFAAHKGLGEALWNNGDLTGAEVEYKTAKRLAPEGDYSADTLLAQLYASLARYDDCLAALQGAGKDGYTLAIHIIKNRADTLSSTVEASRDEFAGGKSTRDQFYEDAKKVSAQTEALADFVSRILPPTAFKLSHLHRVLATNLLAQEAATLVTYIETGDTKTGSSVSQLDKEMQTEMLTALAAEEKHGLWEANNQEAD